VRQINDGISAPSPEIFPGVAAQYRGWENDFVYHCYYRYIPLYLLLQAVFFILPNCLWNYFEKGNLANIIQDLHNTNGQTFDDKRQELIKHSATAIRSMKNTTAYAAKYYLCMMINFLNVVIQFVLTSYFINKGEFFSYGADVISYYVGSDSIVDSKIQDLLTYAHCLPKIRQMQNLPLWTQWNCAVERFFVHDAIECFE
jgi:Innexin.